MSGYMGKVLNVDLSRGEVSVQGLDPEVATQFLGGMGLGTKWLYDEVGPQVDPLGEDNLVVFATGPVTGTEAPCAGRVEVATKSPLTGHLATGDTGGWWGVELKRAGYDAIIVRGRSPHPVYLWIDNGHAELRNAQHLWGRDTWQTTDALRQELGEVGQHQIRILAIGPAGENLVRFAALINEYFHAQGRCGIGAVLGSKKLKAIAVRGSGRVSVARPTEFAAAVREAVHRITTPWHPGLEVPHRAFGSLGVLDASRRQYEQGSLGGRNYQGGVPPQWLEKVTLEAALPYLRGKEGVCYRCPIACFNVAEVNQGKYSGVRIASATFLAPIVEFGGKCGLVDLPAIWKCKEVCHRLGLDLASAAATVAFAMELYQRGIITRDEAGIPLVWGDDDSALEMLHQIAYRRGLGDLLAEGSWQAARSLGGDAQRYAMSIKRLELFAPDPRATGVLWSFGYLTNPRGGDNVKTSHTRLDRLPSPEFIRQRLGMTVEEYVAGYLASLDIPPEEKVQFFGSPPRIDEYSYDGKAALSKWMADLCTAMNCLIFCIFPTTHLNRLGPTHYARLLSAATGMEVTPRELLRIGERVFNLQRLYLARHDIGREEDEWPDRFYAEPLAQGPLAGARLDRDQVERLRREYYRARGWDEATGLPTESKLKELGLTEAAGVS